MAVFYEKQFPSYTTNVRGIAARGGERTVARAPDGKVWLVLYDGVSAQFDVKCLVQSGTVYNTLTPTAGATVALGGTGTVGQPHRSLFIDEDNHAHLVYVDRHTGFVYYRRGVATAGKDGFTWSAAQGLNVANTNSADCAVDVVAHRTGTGWTVHVVYASISATPVVRVWYRRIDITSGGTITVGAQTQVNTTDHTVNEDPKAVLDWHHTGNGWSVKGGTPHVFIQWCGQQANTTHGIRSRQLNYTAPGGVPTWTLGTEQNVNPRSTLGNTQWHGHIWDGTHLMSSCQGTSGSGFVDWLLSERNIAADGALVGSVQTLVSDVNFDDAWYFGGPGMTYDSRGNVIWYGRNDSRDQLMRATWSRVDGTLVGPTYIGSTGPSSTSAYVSVKRGYAVSTAGGAQAEVVHYSDATSPYNVNWQSFELNVAPQAPTLSTPAAGASIDRSVAQAFTWLFADADVGDTQSMYDLGYSLVGGGPETVVSAAVPTTSHTFAANALAAGDYQWRVRTYDATGLAGPWSSYRFFTATTPPSAPTITDPLVNGTIPTDTYVVKWSAPNQTDYEVRRVNDVAGSPGTTVYETTGVVSSTTTRQRTLTFPVNSRTEHVQVRVQNAGLWSAWSSAKVTVSWAPPAAPNVTITPVDVYGVGTATAVRFVVTDGGGVTPANEISLWVRDPATLEERQVADHEPLGTWTWPNPPFGRVFETRVVAWGTNGTKYTGAYTAQTPLALKGVLIHDPKDPASVVHLPYNDDGAEDVFSVEAAVVTYQGRELPSIEFGDGSTQIIRVPRIQIRDADDLTALRALMRRRRTLLYRDSRGRKQFGVILESSAADTFYGYDTSVEFTTVEYAGFW